MAATAEKVTEFVEIQDQIMVKEFGIEELAAANIVLMEKQILEIPEKPETKEHYDQAYRFNVDAKKLLPRIEERRKELKAPVLENGKLIDETAKKAVAMIQPLIEASGVRRQAWEDEKAREKADAERIENERLASIQARFDILNLLASKYQEYNRPSEKLTQDLAHLEEFEISSVNFQERTEEAEQIKFNAITSTTAALENRKKFEADQAEAARAKAEQEAEAKRLKEELAQFEADRKAKEEADRKAAEAEAEILRQEQEALKAEREALEAEKERLAHAAIVADRESVWDVAHQENFDRDHEAALAIHEQLKADELARYRATKKAKAEAAARAKIVGPDKLMITTICNDLDKLISGYEIPALNTEEANALVLDMVATIKEAIHHTEQRGLELV